MHPRHLASLRLLRIVVVAWLAAGCTLAGVGGTPDTGGTPGTAPPGAVAPAASGAPAPSPSPSGPSRPFRPTPTPAPTFATHVVRAGDSLTALARRFATTAESLAYWNRARYPSLDPESPAYRPDRIEVGWRLAYIPGAVVDPENLPPAGADPRAGPGTTPGVAPGAFATLPPDGGAAFVARGPEGLDGVALTFEYSGGAGAGPGGAAAVVQWLTASGIPATVFVSVSAASDPDGAAVLARLGAAGLLATGPLAAGLLARADRPVGLADALRAGDAALLSGLGRSTAPWLRPAGGEAGTEALRVAGMAGWRWAIAWDVDPADGTPPEDGGPIAADIVTRVVARASGGSIVRLQLDGARTLDALPGIVDGLEARGLRVVTLGDLLGLGDSGR